MALSRSRDQGYAALMTPDQQFAFDSIVGFVHRAAMEIAELPKEEHAAALQVVRRSMTEMLGIADPELIDICSEGVAAVLEKIDASVRPDGGRA